MPKMGRAHAKLQRQEITTCYLMLVPYLVGMGAFVIFPLLWVIRYCLYKYTGFIEPIYVGFTNFEKAFTDMEYWRSVGNIFVFAIGKLIIELPLALVLAYILSDRLRGMSFFRTVYFLPSMLSMAVIGVMFKYIFSAYKGVVNEALSAVGITNLFGAEVPINWFGAWGLAMLVMAVASIWNAFGLNMIFFMTGLQSIPYELYEAAAIDGANSRQTFFRITIPMLGPIAQMVVMNALLATLRMADLSLVLTNGEPSGKTEFMMSYIYKKFFPTSGGTGANYGLASAQVIISGVILAIVAIFYLRVTKKSGELY